MSVFKKKGIDIYDYTLLQKKGFIKKEESKKGVEITKDGYFVLGKNEESAEKPQSQSSSENTNPLAFFDNFSAATPTVLSASSSVGSADVDDIKVKLDDFEYKLNRLMEKLAEIETKLKNFEEKVS